MVGYYKYNQCEKCHKHTVWISIEINGITILACLPCLERQLSDVLIDVAKRNI